MYYVIVLHDCGNVLDMIAVYDRDKAIKRGWIDSEGKRIWSSLPIENIRHNALYYVNHTMVFEFRTLEEATTFRDGYKHQLGCKVLEIG